MLLIRAWSSPSDLSEIIRAALLIHPQANVIILPGLGVMVLAPSMQALQRRIAVVERLICLAAGQRPFVSSKCASEAPGEGPSLSGILLSALLILRLKHLSIPARHGQRLQCNNTLWNPKSYGDSARQSLSSPLQDKTAW